jgi:protocatechuate 3,4-dioxygenase alpha subunit
MRLTTTPSQTVGPFFSIGMHPVDIIVGAGVEQLTIQGRVLDGDGDGVSDAVIETWQADADGHYADGCAPRWRRKEALMGT